MFSVVDGPMNPELEALMGEWYHFRDDHRIHLTDPIFSSLKLYLEYGAEPGGFTLGLLENNLSAILRADQHYEKLLVVLVGYLHNRFPEQAQGSKAKVKKWMERGGYRGRPGVKWRKWKGDKDSKWVSLLENEENCNYTAMCNKCEEVKRMDWVNEETNMHICQKCFDTLENIWV